MNAEMITGEMYFLYQKNMIYYTQPKGDDSMPDLGDFYAFKSTSGGSSGGSGGGGCFSWIIGAILVLYIIGKLFG